MVNGCYPGLQGNLSTGAGRGHKQGTRKFAAPDCSSLGFVRGLLLRDGREWEEYLQDKEDWILIVLLGSAPLTIPSPQEQASAGFWLVDGEWC